ncbi:MAG TPA: glycosyltransferase family 4 protein [Chitinophagaceae bacterium]|nr:glycosyltransferase family 4 protein [Chitinophagaceae bacterium]
MKVLFIIRSTSYDIKGGDTFQAIRTANELNKLNVFVDIKRADESIEYERYDLLHFFNLTRPADICYHIRHTLIPFVVSPIWVDYSEYDKHHRKGVSGRVFRFLNANTIEYLKVIARWLANKDRLITFAYLWKRHQACINEIMDKCALLLPNSSLEQKKLTRYYKRKSNYEVIPNGIDPVLFTSDPSARKDPWLVLCVARIEGIKNQLNLIKALNNTSYKLVIIGSPAPNQLSYYRECKKIAGRNIRFIDHLAQEELITYYQKAKVHILPSWFETCGLSSLEAAAMGCNIVITDKGYTREYYEGYAFYCDPASPVSIRKAVEKASWSMPASKLKAKILNQYTWEQAALKTLAAYKKVLSTV